MPFCCVGRKGRREDQYKVSSEPEEEAPAAENAAPGEKQFSWDNRDDEDISDLLIQNVTEGTVCRTYTGQPVVIENCKECVIIVQGNTATVNVDDCRDALIVLGPCAGSVFVRDCESCTVMAVCQQFRTRDCHSVTFAVRAASQPIIEQSTDVVFHPYTVHYENIKADMAAAKLFFFGNRVDSVHDFTPDKAKPNYTISHHVLSISDEARATLDEHGISEDHKLCLFQQHGAIYGSQTMFVTMGKTVEMKGMFYEEAHAKLESELLQHKHVTAVCAYDIDLIGKDYSELPLKTGGFARLSILGVVGDEKELVKVLRRHPYYKLLPLDMSNDMVVAMKGTVMGNKDE